MMSLLGSLDSCFQSVQIGCRNFLVHLLSAFGPLILFFNQLTYLFQHKGLTFVNKFSLFSVVNLYCHIDLKTGHLEPMMI